MLLPSWKIEEELIKENKLAIGIDEAGRGPLAGPVVAAAVWIYPEFFSGLKKDSSAEKKENLRLIRDSKTLSALQREKAFEFILKNKNFIFGLGQCSSKEIDRLNILGATFLAMRMAAENLLEKLQSESIFGEQLPVLLIDGNKKDERIPLEQKTFIGGDSRVFSIAAASILAKVTRDKLMVDYSREFPYYGFAKHKGYGTKLHYENLKKFGPCPLHRRSFRLE